MIFDEETFWSFLLTKSIRQSIIFFHKKKNQKIFQFLPDQIIYITKSCQNFGIVGVSIYLSDLAEDLIYHSNQYSNGDEIYTFLCDKNGVTIWHPSLPRPNIASYDPIYATDIRYFEKVPENIRHRWLTDDNGIVQISKANAWNHKKSVSFQSIQAVFSD